ncbi:hypothetical protein CPC16_006094 [Podila verticillata]|nr:hypothetical protein CPC16_006094 [Podila verticillata]
MEFEESRAIQRQVYACLATQTKMQEQKFYHYHFPLVVHVRHVWISLVMMLESGLDALAYLTEIIEGLFQHFQIQHRVPGANEWIQENKPTRVKPFDFSKSFMWIYSSDDYEDDFSGSDGKATRKSDGKFEDEINSDDTIHDANGEDEYNS